MPERAAALINRAGAVAWCTEKRGMPSLPCAMGDSCWLRTAFAARRGLPACQLMRNWKGREGVGNGWFYIGNGGIGMGIRMGVAVIIGASCDSTNNCAVT